MGVWQLQEIGLARQRLFVLGKLLGRAILIFAMTVAEAEVVAAIVMMMKVVAEH